ncbi:hypothetical protein [Methylobacterium sp. Leaf99]|uniref:hypothetical protein n=1 Tax=Methylobacterium sp. Leaf99 TaxID=1736251 RepID=UPI000AFCDBF6|nr:hypothetical protein [Methylobacterium sp. Leaf99]
MIRLHVERVVLDLMARAARLDWSAWQVEVYNEKGRTVLAKAFTDGRYDRRVKRSFGA